MVQFQWENEEQLYESPWRWPGWQFTANCKLFVASEVLFRDVRRIYLSEFGKGQEEPSLGIKVWACVRAPCLLLSWARRSAGAKILSHDRIWRIWWLEAVRQGPGTSEKQIRCADAQWTLDNDSQSSPTSLKKLKLEEEIINPHLACKSIVHL